MLPQLGLIAEREATKQASLTAGREGAHSVDEAIDFLARGVAGAAGADQAIGRVAEALHHSRGVEIAVRNKTPFRASAIATSCAGMPATVNADRRRARLVRLGSVELHTLDGCEAVP